MALKADLDSPQLTTAASYEQVRQQTEALYAGLSAEDCMVQSMPEASPVKWHLAHSTWFFETFVLAPHAIGYKPYHPDFQSLFNSYYNAIGDRPQRAHRGLFSRPSLEEVLGYRAHVDEAMLRLLDQPAENFSRIAELGLNHEQQHQELIVTDIKHALWSNPLRPAYRPARQMPMPGAPEPEWLQFAGGLVGVGCEGSGFCFDNELPRHEVFLRPFSISSRLVTNREYIDFIADAGYSRSDLWLSDGWDAVRAGAWHAPLYWEKRDGDWWHYTCSGMRRVVEDLDAPVAHVCYYEADAFARWSGARLPTEFEWEVAASEQKEITGNLLESHAFAPLPQSGDSLFGDCWQWMSSAYLAYPGYQPPKGALGEYSGKFMCNQMVLRGGSCAIPRSHIRASYRNFFPSHARWQFSGIRLAKGAT
jgi:ergothioneine biosynthesis protein EgtB